MSPDVEQHFDVKPDHLRSAVEDAIRALGHKVTSQTDVSVSFSTGISLKTSGQRITAMVAGDGGQGSVLSLEGHGRFPQITDWGEKDSLESKLLAEVRSRVPSA